MKHTLTYNDVTSIRISLTMVLQVAGGIIPVTKPILTDCGTQQVLVRSAMMESAGRNGSLALKASKLST